MIAVDYYNIMYVKKTFTFLIKMLFSSSIMFRVNKYYGDLCYFHPDCGSASLKYVSFLKLSSRIISRVNLFKYFPLLFSCCFYIENSKLGILANCSSCELNL